MNGKDIGDIAATTGAVGSYLQFLPEVAAVFAIGWSLLRFYEWFRVRVLGKPQDFKF